jgi:hypothetical protein
MFAPTTTPGIITLALFHLVVRHAAAQCQEYRNAAEFDLIASNRRPSNTDVNVAVVLQV